MQSLLNEPETELWTHIAPLLDEALETLDRRDHDALVLRHWIDRGFAFLGMIGSRRKARTIREHFLAEKIGGEKALAQLSCPVGVKIAAQTVPEIAVSILAQYIDQRAFYAANKTSPPGHAVPLGAPGPESVARRDG